MKNRGTKTYLVEFWAWIENTHYGILFMQKTVGTIEKSILRERGKDLDQIEILNFTSTTYFQVEEYYQS